jgi:hypothetical protein
MRSIHPTRSLPLLFPLALVGALYAWVVLSQSPSHADAGAGLVAGSVCEAHELRALQAADPHLEIEIPKEFDKPFPTREACLSYAAAEDPETPGLLQPIPFSHKHHAGDFQIDCQYCHSSTDVSPSAGVPSVELCMGCHSQFPKEYDQFQGIQTLKEHWAAKEPIEWEQVYRLPEYVQFQHRAHVRAGFDCQRCHGPVETMDKVYVTPDTIWWPWGLPSKKLEMGWCIDCHRENGATQDCYACHY